MSGKIAVYLKETEETGSLNEAGIVKVYLKVNEEWKIVKEIEIHIDQSMSLQGIRSKIQELVEALDECKVLVASKITGVSYTVLDSNGFNLWEMEGKPEEFLNYVLEMENQDEAIKEIAPRYNKNEVYPIETDRDGYYFINLKELQDSNSSITSKQALLLFLRNNDYYELEIICSHIPPWFAKEFELLKLTSDEVKIKSDEYKVRVYHKTCSE